MKFLCRNCKAKYQIADEKVAGRTLRMTCQQCGEPIVVRGPTKQAAQVRQTASQAQATGPAFVPQAAGKAAAAGLAADLSRHMPPAPPEPAQPQEEWHVAINDSPVGPLRRDEVARRIGQGVINRESLAWREGMDDWMQIKHIAELTALFSPVSVVPPTPIAHLAQPPAATQPHVTAASTRSDMAPIGGRKVVPVDESYEPPREAAEPVSEPPPDDESADEIAVATMAAPVPAPVVAIAQEPAAAGRQAPGWAQMFALVSGGAFILAAGALLGVRVLAPTNPAPAPVATVPVAAAPATPPPAAAPVQPPVEQKPEDPGSSVIELDMQAIDGRSAGAKKSGTAAPSGSAASEDSKKKPASSNSSLTAEQRAMLERMGGGLNQGPSNLRAPSEAAKPGGAQGSGQLTAEQLSAVVLKGRTNLTRCYETALRGSPAQDTIRLDVEITVSQNGNVTSVNAAGKSLPGMEECITRTVKMWRFPKSGDSTSTRFPVVFQPGT